MEMINKGCTEQGFLHRKRVVVISGINEHFVIEVVGFFRDDQYCMFVIMHLTLNRRRKL